MNGRVSTSDIALAHYLVAAELGADTSIRRTSTLHFIARQLNNKLQQKSSSYRGAFIAYWINKRRPFSRVNLATATALGLACAEQVADTNKLAVLATELSRGAKIDRLCAIIEA